MDPIVYNMVAYRKQCIALAHERGHCLVCKKHKPLENDTMCKNCRAKATAVIDRILGKKRIK